MGLLGNGIKGNIVTGLAIGVGVAVLAPAVVPAAAGILRPLLKNAIKGGIQLFEQGKVAAAEAVEAAEDLMAEVRVEMQEAPVAATAGMGAAATAKPRARRATRAKKPAAKG